MFEGDVKIVFFTILNTLVGHIFSHNFVVVCTDCH